MKIKDIMSKNLVTCKTSTNIYEISKLMKENNIGFIPIMDDELKGVITDRDIIVKCICNKDKSINSYITSNIVSIDENEDIVSALNLMGKEKIKRLIVTKEGKLVGILSFSDILNTKIDNEILINTLRCIYQVKDNKQNTNPEVDQFYL